MFLLLYTSNIRHLCLFQMHLDSLCRTGPRSAVGNVSGNRCESDCRSRGREFDPGQVPHFRGDFSSLPLIIQEGLLSVTSESMCTKYWVPRFTGKTRITGKTAEIPERPKNNREFKYAIL